MTDFLIFSRNNEISGVIESPGDMIGSIMGLLHGGHPMKLFLQNLKTLHPVGANLTAILGPGFARSRQATLTLSLPR